MREREFMIDSNDASLEYFESLDDICAESICTNELDIPTECIKKIECYEDAFKLYLTPSRKQFNEDWYVNLTRLEFVS